MTSEGSNKAGNKDGPVGGLAAWLLKRLHSVRRPSPRLAVLERIALAPRQSLALVEAEGRRFLVATSTQGTPAFYALDDPGRKAPSGHWNRRAQTDDHQAASVISERIARVSW